MITTCPTCGKTYNTIVSGVSCPFCALTLDELLVLLGECLDDMDDYNATDRYNEAQWARSGTNYGWYTGDRGR